MLCLVASPLLGAKSWSFVGDRLSAAGWSVTVVATTAAQSGESALVASDLIRQLPTDPNIVLIVHSNAGAYVPAMVNARSVRAVVFVDAVVPPATGATPLTRQEFVPTLQSLADEQGLLPIWTRWWDPALIEETLPIADVRHQIEEEQVRIPLSYFRQTVIAGTGWDRVPAGYIEFGSAYDAEREKAEKRNWPVRVLDTHHLAIVTEADVVAAVVIDVLRELGIEAP
jgi:hypothetical protein